MKHIVVALGAAILSSLCCIVPVLAIVAGTSGLATTITWLEPMRPFLIGATVLVLGLAWFQKLRRRKETQCQCEAGGRLKFVQSKLFLGIVTFFVVTILLFPNYVDLFYPKSERQVTSSGNIHLKTVSIPIEGMTCTGCEAHIEHEVDKLPGVVKSTASYQNGSARVEFDGSMTDLPQIEKAIMSAGYRVIDKKKGQE